MFTKNISSNIKCFVTSELSVSGATHISRVYDRQGRRAKSVKNICGKGKLDAMLLCGFLPANVLTGIKYLQDYDKQLSTPVKVMTSFSVNFCRKRFFLERVSFW